MRERRIFRNWGGLGALALVFITTTANASDLSHLGEHGVHQTQTLTADKENTWTFPDLPVTLNTMVTGKAMAAKMTVYLPKDYSPSKKFPLVVLITGAEGQTGETASFAREVVGDEGYICVGLPSFKEKIEPLDADNKNYWNRMFIRPSDGPTIWKAYKTMFAKLFAEVPNIDRDRTVIGGFSNGAHTPSAILSNQEESKEFLVMFHRFIFIEGGMGVIEQPELKGTQFFLLRGSKNEHDFHARLKEKLTKSEAVFSEYIMDGVGHDFSPAGKVEVKKWIETQLKPPLVK